MEETTMAKTTPVNERDRPSTEEAPYSHDASNPHSKEEAKSQARLSDASLAEHPPQEDATYASPTALPDHSDRHGHEYVPRETSLSNTGRGNRASVDDMKPTRAESGEPHKQPSLPSEQAGTTTLSRRPSWPVAASAKGLALAFAIVVLATYVVVRRETLTADARGAAQRSAGVALAGPAGAFIPLGPSISTSAAAQIVGPRIALVIGNSNYRYVAQLTNPINDARLMARTLQRVGFKLVGDGAQIDLDKSGFDRVLQAFADQLPGASVALFYYAGHGMQLSGENYLVPTAANPKRESDVRLQMVDASLIVDQMQDAGARLNILILDACRNNPFGGRGIRSAGGGLAPMQAPEGTLIAYATQPGAVASDGKGGDSPYTLALTQVMLQPSVEVQKTFNEVGLMVSKETGDLQVPWTETSPITGDFYFSGPPAPLTKPEPAPDISVQSEENAEIVFWQSIEKSKNPRDFDAYLKQFPSGQFAVLAQVRRSEFGAPKQVASLAPSVSSEIVVHGNERLPPGNEPSPLSDSTPSLPSSRHRRLAATESPSTMVRPAPNTSLSRSLSDYLHHNRLPYVDALVLSDQTGTPSSLVLSGRVRTEMGKRDAELKSRDFLGTSNIRISNEIVLHSDLASQSALASPATDRPPTAEAGRNLASNSCFDQCVQISDNCRTACETQSTGSTIAQVGGVAGALMSGNTSDVSGLAPSLLQGDHKVCANRCEADKNTCTQLCGLKSGQY
jgi:caspase domain-containing protein